MWNSLAKIILRYGYLWLIVLLGATAFLGWHASKVKLSYEFSRAIPTDNPKYKEYEDFRKKFGDDGNLLAIGVQTKDFFNQSIFNDYVALETGIKKVNGVETIISVPSAVNLVRNESENFDAVRIFRDSVLSQQEIDSSKNVNCNVMPNRHYAICKPCNGEADS